MKVMMVASEMMPFAKTGGLADVVGALPLALAELGDQVSVVIPCYRGVEEKWKPEHTGMELKFPVLQGDHYIDKCGQVLHTSLNAKVQVYLVKMDEYYDREALYETQEGDYEDNCARFMFLCQAALEMVRSGFLQPDVIHCHDWQSALAPIYLNTTSKNEPGLEGLPVVFTIHNLGYQGIFWHWDMRLIGLPWDYFTVDFLEYHGKISLLKGALVSAHAITTVSKGYTREIQTPEYGYGLEGVLAQRSRDLYGIINGIDYTIWNPETDTEIEANYSVRDLAGKARCKQALQKELGLPQSPEVPLVASISRLADQKGFDLVAAVMDKIMESDMQFVLLGTGDKKYHRIFEDLERNCPQKLSVNIKYNETLAHRIEAGADMFLMPSRYEPCGLNQLISKKYGTVPVVRATGGLEDTIVHWDPESATGNGFKFKDYTPEALWKTLNLALATYKNKKEWQRIIMNAMYDDHSWRASADQYRLVYNAVIK